MSLLILNRRPIVEQLPAWLGDLGHDLVLVTARSVVTPETLGRVGDSFREILVVDDYDETEVEALILHTAERHRVVRILSSTETDVLRAARARERLGLPGQSYASARAFREKHLMKRLVSAAGLAVAEMKELLGPDDLWAFAGEHGFPVVVKPGAGGGSVGVRVLADRGQAVRFLEERDSDLQEGSGGRLLAETWVEGDFFTIDGLMQDGKVLQQWPSRTVANLSAVLGPRPLTSGMLGRKDPLTHRLKDFVAAVIAALPPAEDITAFHAEAFHTCDDRLVLCEVACRPGGCGHVPVYEHALGVNLYAATLRGQAGDRIPPEDRTGSPRRMAGFAWFPPRPGVLRRLPDTCPLPGVYSYTTSGEVGRPYDGSRSVADSVARALVEGPPDEEISHRMLAVERWWNRACVWGSPGAP